MDFDGLANELLASIIPNQRFVLGLIGPPASGKSTLASELAKAINADDKGRAVVLPMDGFHLSNEKLEELGLLSLKGIPQSFDAQAFVDLVRSIKTEADQIYGAPEFRREIEASIADAIEILPSHDIVIVEGNYLLLKDEPWCQLANHLDEVWYLSLGEKVRQDRLLNRHIENCRSREEAKEKIRITDDSNALLIEETKVRANRILSVD